MTTSILIEGKIAINAVLNSKYRKILTLFYDVAKLKRKRDIKPAKSLKKILESANSKEIKVEAVDHNWFDKNAKGKTHGGIAAIVSERTYQEIHELPRSKLSVIFFLDGIEDPYNLGYTIRSLYTAGIDGIVMKQRNWLDVEPIIIKSSAGTSELMPIALVEDLKTTASFFKSNNFTIVCTIKDKGKSIFESNLKPPIFVVIGGEKRGIDHAFLEIADLQCTIPYKRDFTGSLPLSSAATIIGFEILRQRDYSQKRAI